MSLSFNGLRPKSHVREPRDPVETSHGKRHQDYRFYPTAKYIVQPGFTTEAADTYLIVSHQQHTHAHAPTHTRTHTQYQGCHICTALHQDALHDKIHALLSPARDTCKCTLDLAAAALHCPVLQLHCNLLHDKNPASFAPTGAGYIHYKARHGFHCTALHFTVLA